MIRKQKEQVVARLSERLAAADTVMLINYQGLSVEETNQLRRELRGAQAGLMVVKNSLLERAAAGTQFASCLEFLDGPTALALTGEDPVAAAKILLEFAKQHPPLVIKGAVIDGVPISAKDVEELSRLPSREGLLGMVVGAIAAPLTAFVRVLNAPIQGLITALDAIRRQKESGDGGSSEN